MTKMTNPTSSLAQTQPLSPDVPHFMAEASTSGINHIYDGPFEFFVGGGGASFDCNGDRLPELFLAGGTNEAGFYINQSPSNGDLKFTQATLIESEANPINVTGAYAINIDNVQYTDLIILRVGENLIY